MRTLKVPFQIDSRGGLAVVEDTDTIVRQQIIDILVTAFYERPMNPLYGAGLQNIVFQPILSSMLALEESTVRSLLASRVTLAKITSVTLVQSKVVPSRIDVAVSYSLIPSTVTTTLRTSVSALVTEDTFVNVL